jgi:hypothetical protein
MRRLYIFLPVVVLLEYFLWNLPREIVHADNNLVRGIGMFGTVFIFIPSFMYLAFSKLKSRNWMMLAILSIPINGIGFASRIQINEAKMLLKEGERAIGIVIDTKSVNIRTDPCEWAVVADYKVEGTTYQTDWVSDCTSSYQLGDTVTIIYLRDYPKVYQIAFDQK